MDARSSSGRVRKKGKTMKWIRTDTHARYHAVLAEHGDVYTTWCGRKAGMGVRVTDAPPARCQACQGRIRRPYLLPVELRELANRKTMGAA